MVNKAYHVNMDDIKEHRRQRLKELLQFTYGGAHGAQVLAAERIGCEKAYLTRILSEPEKAGHRKIGEDFQHRIETAFDLPIGWLDQPFGTPVPIKQYGAAPQAQPALASEQQAGYVVKPSAQAWPFQKLTREQWGALDVTQRTALENGLIEFVRAMMASGQNHHQAAM